MSEVRAIVLAAGQGTRMKSDLPKVLVPVDGRPMIDYVVDMLAACGIAQTIVVVGYRSELVREHLAGRPGLVFVEQTERKGTGHAVMMCRDALAGFSGQVVIVAGDSPLIRPESISALLAEHQRNGTACLLGTAHKEDPTGLGRIVRDASGKFVGIVEEKDATPEQRRITEVNMSCYVFTSQALLRSLERLRADNAQKEYYLTDCPGILRAAGDEVDALAVLTPRETLSINTTDELAIVEAAMKGRS
ncbi:MAG: NTP transferase domain-containing protein [Planctomycetia bacterium]|nr:NTP transferase domain-containing protein [Planctomycetia bacterium]